MTLSPSKPDQLTKQKQSKTILQAPLLKYILILSSDLFYINISLSHE